jgi:hypothetical protein
MLDFPSSRPDAEESASFLWFIQNELLSRAESFFGSRDETKRIYQPIFRADGPILVNTNSFDGAYAALSFNAAGYWPTLVYELAHETIHLLDPVRGATNCLEEGVAVQFSILMSRTLTRHSMAPDSDSEYARVASLIDQLPQPLFNSIRLIRNSIGRLSAATPSDICSTQPSVSVALAHSLAKQCIPR